MAILSDTGTVCNNKVLNDIYDQLNINRLFSNPFHPQDNAKAENVHNFEKESSQNSWTAAIFSEMISFYLLVIAITYFQTVMVLNLNSFICFDEIQQKNASLTLTIAMGIIEPMKGK